MRIAVLSRSTTKHISSGGMETQLKNLVEGLASVGANITVITTSYSKFPTEKINKDDVEITEKGVDYYYIGDTTPGLRPLTKWEQIFLKLGLLKRGISVEGKKNYFEESKKVFKKLHENKPFDVVISQSTIGYGVINDSDFNLPSLAIIHGTIKSEIKNRFKANKTLMNWGRFLAVDLPSMVFELYTANRKFFNKVDKVVAVSKRLKQQFAQDHPKLIQKVVVIYNGVDESKFKPSNNKYDKFTCLYIGRVDREKGVDTIIEVANKLIDEKGITNIEFLIIGNGIQSHINDFKTQISKYNLDSVVKMLGPKRNDELIEFYQKSHLFIFPTRREEGHPMTISEAFCSGLPVIATKKGGLVELIDNNLNGYLVNENDVIKLSSLISLLYNDRRKLKELSENAYKKGIAQFSQKSMVQNYLSLLKSIL